MYANTELVFTTFCFYSVASTKVSFIQGIFLQDISCSFWPFPTLMKHLFLDKLLLRSYIFDSLVSIFMKANARINICASLFLQPSFC